MITDPPDVVRLAQIKMSLQEKLTILDAEILELVESEHAAMEEIEQSDVFKQDMYAVLEQLSLQGSAHAPPESPYVTPRSDLHSGAAGKVRLPKLTIQPLRSSATYVPCYRDRHLRLSGLALFDANYKQAVDILRKRFGNKQVIIAKHMDVLMNLEPVASDRHLRPAQVVWQH